MPRLILKRSPTADEYMEYSTVVDAPVSTIANREEMARYLNTTTLASPEQTELRLARADLTGTSSHLRWYAFDEAPPWLNGHPSGRPVCYRSRERFFDAARKASPTGDTQ